MSTKMRAVVYKGPNEVEVREVEKPRIQHPDDVIVKVSRRGREGALANCTTWTFSGLCAGKAGRRFTAGIMAQMRSIALRGMRC